MTAFFWPRLSAVFAPILVENRRNESFTESLLSLAYFPAAEKITLQEMVGKGRFQRLRLMLRPFPAITGYENGPLLVPTGNHEIRERRRRVSTRLKGQGWFRDLVTHPSLLMHPPKGAENLPESDSVCFPASDHQGVFSVGYHRMRVDPYQGGIDRRCRPRRW